MSCPTCTHTMQTVAKETFWCPRCGTLKLRSGLDTDHTPRLVVRCQRFAETLGPRWLELWRTMGIEESVGLAVFPVAEGSVPRE
jgi:hypothetical protein